MSYASLIGPFILGGAGMALVFAPAANAVLSAVCTHQAGQASGAINAIRELGGVLGVAVLATVFTSHGGYASPQAFVTGLPAVWVGVAVLAGGRADRGGAAVQQPGGAPRRQSSAPPSAPAQHRPPLASGRRPAYDRPRSTMTTDRASPPPHPPSACPGLRAPGRADRGGRARVRPGRPARDAGRQDRAARGRRAAVRVQPVREQA